MLKIYLVSRNAYSWLEDYKMVVIAEDEKEAKTIARKTSLDFAHDNNIGVEEVDPPAARRSRSSQISRTISPPTAV